MNGHEYKNGYDEIKNDPNVVILHDSISPTNDNEYGLKEGMKVPYSTLGTATISWITGAGEVFFKEGNVGWSYDYEIAQDILVKKHGKKKAMNKWKKKYGSWD